MRLNTRKLHLIVGALGILLFLFTGLVLRARALELEGSDRLRFSLRASHIYILLTALLNLGLGAYLTPRAVRWRAGLQVAGTVLVLVGAVVLALAFFIEPKVGLDRPMTLAGVVASLAGTVLHAGSGAAER